MVTIEGYLVQKKLEAALKQLVGDENWCGHELRVPDSRWRWDMAYRLQGQTTVVEFDRNVPESVLNSRKTATSI